MPIYRLKCQSCGHVTTQVLKVDSRDKQTCQQLRGQGSKVCEGKLLPMIAPTSFALKGGGWYKDGYR